MDQSYKNRENSIEKQYSKANPENHTYATFFHTQKQYSSTSNIPNSELKYQKASQNSSSYANGGSIRLNGIQRDSAGHNIDYKMKKEELKPEGGLESVPEISYDHSEITNKTSQIDPETYKENTGYDNEDKKFAKSLHFLARDFHRLKYEPSLKLVSESADIKMTSGLRRDRGDHYLSPEHRLQAGGSAREYRNENGNNMTDREPLSSTKSNALMSDERRNSRERSSQIHKPSQSEANPLLSRNVEYFAKLSKSDFGPRNLREERMPLSAEGFRRFSDENERLEDRRMEQRAALEMKNELEERYRNYQEMKADVERQQKEREAFLAQKMRLKQLEEMEATIKQENEEIKLNDARKDKIINDLKSQIEVFKEEISFLNKRNEANMETLKGEVKRLEEENIKLVQASKKAETKKANLIHQLEISNDEEKWLLKKDLQEKILQLQSLTTKNEELARKVEKLKKFNQEKEKERREKIEESMSETKRIIIEEANQIKEDTRKHYQAKIESLQGKVKALMAENENLKLEIQSKPSSRKFREYEARINALENELKQSSQESRKKPSDISVPAKILKDIAEELDIDSVGALLPKIKELHQEHKADSKLVNSLFDMIQKCSPPGYFEGKPTHKQAWNWIKRIMEEYMLMKKQEGGSDLGPDKELINKIIAKVKYLHNIEWINSLNELDQKLSFEVNNRQDTYYRKNIS